MKNFGSGYGLSIDKYLTSEPFCKLDNYIENILEYFSEDFYNENEGWFESDIFIKWCDKLCYQEQMSIYQKRSYSEATILIERAHKFYKL